MGEHFLTQFKLPESVTDPCLRFLKYQEEVLEILLLLIGSEKQSKAVQDLLAGTHIQASSNRDHLLARERILKDSQIVERQARRLAMPILEMIFSRAVENFLTFASELMAAIYTTRPTTLRTSETITVEEVLSYGTMDDLIQLLTERKVERLSYKGMQDLRNYLNEKLNFDLFPDPDCLSRAVRIVETRNLITHNRGVVNRTFLRKTGNTSLKVGMPVPFDPVEVLVDVEFLGVSATEIDERAASKFTLRREPNTVAQSVLIHTCEKADPEKAH